MIPSAPATSREQERCNGRLGFAPVIEFRDDAQTRWRVSERDCRKDPGTHGEWCLLFTSDDAVRRVWEYPNDWHLLSAVALTALSWQR